jgi:hypothetical protein
MQANMNLVVEFKGSQTINGVPARYQGSQDDVTPKGGFISNNNTEGNAIFGNIVSVNKAADASELLMGANGTGDANNIILGPLMNDQSVRMFDPAKPSWKMNGMPATVAREGTLLYNKWNANATNAIQPVMGCRIIGNNATGEIQFLPAGNTVPSGWTQLNAVVADVDTFTGIVAIYFNFGPNT